MRSYTAPTLLTAVLAFGLFSSPSLGSNPYCGQFELISGEKTVHRIDESPEGDSIGDIRTGIVNFIDPRTDDVIKMYYRSKIFVLGEDGVHTFQGDYVWEFPDGALLFTRGLYGRTNDTRPSGLRGPQAKQGILGGSGAFAKVTGTITGGPGDPAVRRFDLDCG